MRTHNHYPWTHCPRQVTERGVLPRASGPVLRSSRQSPCWADSRAGSLPCTRRPIGDRHSAMGRDRRVGVVHVAKIRVHSTSQQRLRLPIHVGRVSDSRRSSACHGLRADRLDLLAFPNGCSGHRCAASATRSSPECLYVWAEQSGIRTPFSVAKAQPEARCLRRAYQTPWMSAGMRRPIRPSA